MPLQRIEPWVPASREEEVQALEFGSGECPEHFVNAGLLLRHYRQEHSVAASQHDWPAVPVNPGQEIVDDEHWTAPERKPWACDRGSCEYRARNRRYLLRHQKFAHDKYRAFFCDACTFSSANHIQLEIHQATVHRGEKTSICPYPECGRGFGQESVRDKFISSVPNTSSKADAATIPCCSSVRSTASPKRSSIALTDKGKVVDRVYGSGSLPSFPLAYAA
ncbi:transcription factor [Fusarium flagelliforme]|uniref:Transcription factor n=1 Tax=Fusarium flagelliforme TaxID=2675880 RepID=A0A395MZV0_9HYPO|nr:transcription factor [Fusarium flagelliforme]